MTNSTFNTSSNCTDDSHEVRIAAEFTYLALGCICLSGNLILITALCKSNFVKLGGYLTLVHYAVTDLVNGLLFLFYMPVAIYFQNSLIPDFIPGLFLTFGEFSRKVFLVFMALTRFYSVMSPMAARFRMTLSWYKKALATTWCVSFCVCLPLWVGHSFLFFPSSFKFGFNKDMWPWLPWYSFGLNVFVTLVILVTYPICFVYLKRQRYMWKVQSYSGSVHMIQGSQCSSSKEKALLIMFALNSAIFILYWLPIYLCELWSISLTNYGLIKEVIRGIQISYNPFAYYCLNKGIRTAINDLFRKATVEKKISANNAKF